MKNDDFDKIARESLGFDPGGPSERVWRRIETRRRSDRVPSPREILISGLASAAVLLIAWVVSSGSAGSTPLSEYSETNSAFQTAVRDDTRLTLAAITKIEGM
ncbi:MAG: hypothetical protein H7Y17_10220 [Chlorobia bacterium]|nr:hypothetical protein [Fimbriimonadaceae bacterium]